MIQNIGRRWYGCVTKVIQNIGRRWYGRVTKVIQLKDADDMDVYKYTFTLYTVCGVLLLQVRGNISCNKIDWSYFNAWPDGKPTDSSGRRTLGRKTFYRTNTYPNRLWPNRHLGKWKYGCYLILSKKVEFGLVRIGSIKVGIRLG